MLLRQAFLNNINIELSLQEHDKDEEERFYAYIFHTPESPTESFTFIYFCLVVWLWAMYLALLISSFLTCKMKVIIVFTSYVILKIIRNIACEMLNIRFGKYAMSSASSHF